MTLILFPSSQKLACPDALIFGCKSALHSTLISSKWTGADSGTFLLAGNAGQRKSLSNGAHGRQRPGQWHHFAAVGQDSGRIHPDTSHGKVAICNLNFSKKRKKWRCKSNHFRRLIRPWNPRSSPVSCTNGSTWFSATNRKVRPLDVVATNLRSHFGLKMEPNESKSRLLMAPWRLEESAEFPPRLLCVGTCFYFGEVNEISHTDTVLVSCSPRPPQRPFHSVPVSSRRCHYLLCFFRRIFGAWSINMSVASSTLSTPSFHSAWMAHIFTRTTLFEFQSEK